MICWMLACAQKPSVFRKITSIDEVPPKNVYDKVDFETFDQRLNFLLNVQNDIPNVLERASEFSVNLFEILEDQQEIQEHLLADEEYRTLMDQFHSKQLEIKVSPKKNQKVFTYQTDSAELNRFRWDLKEALAEYKTIKEVKRVLFNKIQALGLRSSRGLETGLIKSLSKGLQKSAFEIHDKKALSAYLAKHLPARLPNEFKASDYNLVANVKKEEVLKKLTHIRALEERSSILMALMLLHAEAVGDFNADVLRIERSKLSLFSNKEVLSVHFDRLKNGELRNLSEKVNDNIFQLTLNFFRNYSSKIQVEEEWLDGELTIKQIPPSLAIFRGYIGSDCATKRSFPYVNLPTELVFYIYDKNHKAKGYVEGHIVENAQGEKVFKIISFNGPKISTQDVLLTLEALHASRNELKVAYIAMPALDRIDSLINYDVIKATLKESIAKSKLEEITYLDAKYRTYLSELGGTYNESTYDAMELNSNAVRYHSEDLSISTQKRWYSINYQEMKNKTKRHLDFLFKSNMAFASFEKNIDDVSYVKYEYEDIIKETSFDELFKKFKYYLNLKDEDLYVAVRDYYNYFSKTTDFQVRVNQMPLAFFQTLSDDQIKKTFNALKSPSQKMMRLLIVEGDEKLRRMAFSYMGSKTEYYLDNILEEVILKLSADDFNVMFSTMKNKISDQFYQKHMDLFFDKGDSGTRRHLINKLEIIKDKKLIKKILKDADSSYVNSIITNNLSLSKNHIDQEILELILARKDRGNNQKLIEQIFSKDWSLSYEKYFKEIINDQNNMISLSQLTRSPLFMKEKNIESILLDRIKSIENQDKNGEALKNAIRSMISEKSTEKNYKLFHMLFDEFGLKAFDVFVSSKMMEREADYNQQFAKELLVKIKRSKNKSLYYKAIEARAFNSYLNVSFNFLYDYAMSLNPSEQIKFLENLISLRNAYKPEKQILLLHELVKTNRITLLRNKALVERINAYLKKHQENNSLEAESIRKWLSTPPEIKKIELNCSEMIRLFYK